MTWCTTIHLSILLSVPRYPVQTPLKEQEGEQLTRRRTILKAKHQAPMYSR